MDERGWTVRIIWRYTLLQLPAIALLVMSLIMVRRWIWDDMPFWLLGSIIGFWIAKDIIMFRYVWRSYDWDRSSESNSMIGERGLAKERLAPLGYIQIRGELWRSRVMDDSPPVEKGETVQVRDINGLTLLVESCNEETQK
ncbi:MAG: NfeD family protein [Spirochaetota bacterium]|nr:NfeD family protein [Spirochaetota bacterium]